MHCRYKGTWPPWEEVLRRAVKVPASEKSEPLNECSKENWTLESPSEAEDFLRADWTWEDGGGGDAVTSSRWGDPISNPPSRPKSSSSTRSSSDWKLKHVFSVVAINSSSRRRALAGAGYLLLILFDPSEKCNTQLPTLRSLLRMVTIKTQVKVLRKCEV